MGKIRGGKIRNNQGVSHFGSGDGEVRDGAGLGKVKRGNWGCLGS